MDRGKSKSDYASAYKLSRAGKEESHVRVRRRSEECRDQRQKQVNLRRNIGTDLTPIDEGNTRDKSYKDKTPVKRTDVPRVKKQCQDRLEMLKKWKAEKEEKRKLEAQCKNPVFRVTASFKRQDEQKLFQNSTLKTKSSVPGKKEMANKSLDKRPGKGSGFKLGVRGQSGLKSSQPKQDSAHVTRQTATKQDHGLPPAQRAVRGRAVAPPAKAPVSRSTTTTTGRVTRQSARLKAAEQKQTKAATKSPKHKPSAMDSINVNRGSCMSTDGDSFAPADFAFTAPGNLSSFVFKPLSPKSAADFLFPGQNSTSFMGTSPKRCSTPIGKKNRLSDLASAKDRLTEKCADTLLLENTAVHVTEETCVEDRTMQAEDVPSKSPEKTPEHASTAVEVQITDQTDDQAMETTKIDITPQKSRRSVRRSIRLASEQSSTNNCDEMTMNIETDQHHGSQISTVASPASGPNTTEIPSELSHAKSSAKKVRRSLRQSVLQAQEDKPVEAVAPADDDVSDVSAKESSSRKSLPQTSVGAQKQTDMSSSVTDSPSKRTRARRSLVGSNGSETGVNTPTKTSRRSLRKAVLTTDRSSEDDVGIGSPPKRQRTDQTDSVQSDSGDQSSEGSTSSALEDSVFESVSTEAKEEVDSKLKENDLGEQKRSPKELNKKTPVAKKKSRQTFGGFLQPDANSVVLSGKRRPRRSHIPKSPEEWIEVLSNSPMVEMSRRKPKAKSPDDVQATLNFDDVDLQEPTAAVEHIQTSCPSASNVLVESSNEVVTEGNSEVVTEGISEVVTEGSSEVVTEGNSEVKTEGSSESEAESSTKEHDVKYFRDLLVCETARFLGLCDIWDEVNNTSELTEEVRGQIRTIVGKAHLLINQRFKQFSGLVDDCEFKRGVKETTPMDLQGFWDMIYFQVEEIDGKFAELQKLKANNWQEEKPKPVVKKVKKKAAAVVKKPVAKSKFADFRKQMKKQKGEAENAPEVQEKVFDFGLFKVASPVRTPKFHCDAGTPKKLLSAEVKTENVPVLTLTNSGSDPVRRTPVRKSYLPIVPSPLLQDTTPKPRPQRHCVKSMLQRAYEDDPENMTAGINKENAVSSEKIPSSPRSRNTPKRRSLRSRKSVNFEENSCQQAEPPTVCGSESDFLRLLQPLSQDKEEETTALNNSLSKYLKPTDLDTLEKESPKPRRRRSSSLKMCKSAERRRSRRSVNFQSPTCTTKHAETLNFTRTPHNRNSLLQEKRVTRHSLMENTAQESSPVCRSSRPSLLFTPPKMSRTKVVKDVPTATLVSFSP